MFLSIIIPTYNDELYLNECLDSCLDQDYPDDDYEIICVDDGSSDRTPEMLRGYANQHSNIHLIFKKHSGAGGRVIGFEQAQGDYIWFVDHDDIIAPDAIPLLKSAVESNTDCDRVQFPYYQFYNSLSGEEHSSLKQRTLVANDSGKHKDNVVWDGIFKRKFLDDNNINPLSIRIKEAGVFWGISPFRIKGGDTVFVEECIDKGMNTVFLEGRPLYHYRRHTQSQTIDYSKSEIAEKEKRFYHTVLLHLYLALKSKDNYLRQRQEKGYSDHEIAVDAITRLRKATTELLLLPDKYWKSGMRLAKEKNAFFETRVPDYSYRFFDYIKTKSIRERLKPDTVLYYYLYTEWCVKLLRFLRTGERIRNQSTLWKKWKHLVRQRQNQNKGN